MIGVLALQGDFERHCARIESVGAKWRLVKKAADLQSVRGLIIPGGESSVLLKLCDESLKSQLISKISGGLPVLATCAGIIFLAYQVENPKQDSLKVLDIDVRRNAYGRQVDSFIDDKLHWTEAGKRELQKRLGLAKEIPEGGMEGVFIRAPKITRTGPAVKVLIERETEPVLIQQQNIFGATFHPELSEKSKLLHELFLAACS